MIHQEPEKIYSNPAVISEPRDGLVMGIPSPRKDSAASLMIALATCTVEITRTGDRVLGRICRHMIRKREKPITLAASTYSLRRSASTEARTVRAYWGHSARPIIRMSSGAAIRFVIRYAEGRLEDTRR